MFLRKGDVDSWPLFGPDRFCAYIKGRRGAESATEAALVAVGVFTGAKLKAFAELTHAEELPGHIHRKLRGTWKGRPIDIVHFGVDAPITVATLEEMVCLGTRNIITFGSSGGIQPDLKPGSLIVPTHAIREEGASYHYLPADEQVGPTQEALEALRVSLAGHGLAWREGSVWTTDAIYREYVSKVREYRSQGVLSVEMECSAVFAVARVLGIRAATLLYVSDVLSEDWTPAFAEPEIEEVIQAAAPAVLDAALALED